jgi:prepilin-type N-terminal cleavage/methylation domain-containing protein
MRAAFSLVELSIVLVILGLLTGGILTGQNLIRAAELRGITTEFQTYQTAVMTFRDKYFALPGDMVNATNFWSAAATCPGDNSTPSTDKATCNGNGNGSIGEIGVTGERYRFWHHLSNAGLIQGSYTGVTGPDSTDHAIGNENVPASRISNGTWYASERPPNVSGQFIFDTGNMFILGAPKDTTLPTEPLLAAEEMWNIDTKIDDGKPGRGKLIPWHYADCTDATSTTDYDASYDLQNTDIACALLFKDSL